MRRAMDPRFEAGYHQRGECVHWGEIMKLLRIVGCFSMLVALGGFSDASGRYSLSVPSGWSATQSTPDVVIYSPYGDPHIGAIAIVRDASSSGTLFDILSIYKHSQIVSTEKISVAGRDCLHAVGREQETHVVVIDHWLVCDLASTPYPGTRLNFAFDVSAAQGNNYGIDPERVYWSVVNSIQWLK